jgi:aromatic-amino-acid transaminase
MTVETYPFVDIATQSMRFDALLDAVGRAAPGDVVLLHGCCHNPTGAELSPEHWQQVVALMVERRVVPLVDLAYQGLGGGLQRDRLGAELCLANFSEVFVAYSCDKNFGLYRERVGALWVKTGSAARVPAVRANLLALARVNWSMPPDHGAAAVRIVLGDPALRAQWLDELEGMRLRLSEVRGLLAERYPALAALRDHTGLFTTLPLPRDAIAMLRDEHGIYMAPSGRINVAGLNRDNLDRFGRAVTPYLTA